MTFQFPSSEQLRHTPNPRGMALMPMIVCRLRLDWLKIILRHFGSLVVGLTLERDLHSWYEWYTTDVE